MLRLSFKQRLKTVLALPRFRSSFDHVHSSPSPSPSKSQLTLDPYSLLANHLAHVRETLLTLLSSSVHPGLSDVARLYFLHPSTQIRPLLVLLFARATNGLARGWDAKRRHATSTSTSTNYDPLLASPLSLHTTPPPIHASQPLLSSDTRQPSSHSPPPLFPTQLRLAQIVEMIHIASLLHSGLSDTTPSPSEETNPTPSSALGDKLSVLGGDFLLGRACAAVSRLGDSRVVELTASIIANIAEGEVLHTRPMPIPNLSSTALQDAWNVYLQKTYLRTASLMAKGARASVVLGGGAEGEPCTEVAYVYGRNLGLAFQLVDDIFEYESGLGKPGPTADPRSCPATGPVLYAWEAHPEMGPLIARNFELEGDAETARDFVQRSSGVERTRDLSRQYADKAQEALQLLPDSDAKTALDVLADHVVERTC